MGKQHEEFNNKKYWLLSLKIKAEAGNLKKTITNVKDKALMPILTFLLVCSDPFSI